MELFRIYFLFLRCNLSYRENIGKEVVLLDFFYNLHFRAGNRTKGVATMKIFTSAVVATGSRQVDFFQKFYYLVLTI